MNKYIEKLINDIENIDNDDQTIFDLETAMNHYCSMWDICEGYKHALIKTLTDQYENHPDEQPLDDLVELKRILKL